MNLKLMGDIVGSIYEFNPPHEEEQIEIFSDISFITDDSVLMLAIGEYIIDGRKKSIKSYFKDYYNRYPNKSYGLGFTSWVKGDMKLNRESLGNGALMRIGLIIYLTNSLTEALDIGKEVTFSSHGHPSSMKAVNDMITISWNVVHKNMNKDTAKEMFISLGYDFKPYVEYLYNKDNYTEKVIPTFEQAFSCWYHSDTYEEMLAKVIRLKNDTDTCAIIASQFFSCYDNKDIYKDFINTKLDDFLKSKINKIQKVIDLNAQQEKTL